MDDLSLPETEEWSTAANRATGNECWGVRYSKDVATTRRTQLICTMAPPGQQSKHYTAMMRHFSIICVDSDNEALTAIYMSIMSWQSRAPHARPAPESDYCRLQAVQQGHLLPPKKSHYTFICEIIASYLSSSEPQGTFKLRSRKRFFQSFGYMSAPASSQMASGRDGSNVDVEAISEVLKLTSIII